MKQARSLGAVWTVSHSARRLGIAQAVGPTRAGKLALWHVMAQGIDQGARLSAVRLAMAHATCEVLGVGTFEADALEDHLAGLANRQAAVEAPLFAQRPRTKPGSLFGSEVPRS